MLIASASAGAGLLLLLGCNSSSGGAVATTPAKTYASVPTPTATYEPAGDTPGSADHNYPFFSMDINLAQLGYVEQEFFIQGTGNTYNTPSMSGGVDNLQTTPGTTATVVSSGNPYLTRMVVYRPTDPAKFNGTAIMEWQNVTNGYDTPVQWFQQKDFVIRNGYAWIEVSAQSASITNATTGLKVWSPIRYGNLDVTDGGTIANDLLSYDIFGQAAKSVRTDPKVLGGLQVNKLIAIGNSQSAGRLSIYLNCVQPIQQIFDGAILVVGGSTMRTDLGIPIIKALSESEEASITNEDAVLQADTNNLVTWQVTGSSHSEIYGAAVRGTMLLRDLNKVIGDVPLPSYGFSYAPSRSRIPYRYVHNNAIRKIEDYISNGTALPTVPQRIVTLDPSVPSVERDAYGNALGGLRMPNIVAPIATDQGNISVAGVTPYCGYHMPFTMAQLAGLYSSHDDYVQKFTTAANQCVASGWMLQEDADEDIANASASLIGTGLPCDASAPLVEDFSQFPMFPTILDARLQVYVYNIADRNQLLAQIDQATYELASGYMVAATSGATKSDYDAHYQNAINYLNNYITLVQAEATTVGSISQLTANYLVGQANTMITQIQTIM